MKAIINGIFVTENEIIKNKALIFDECIIGFSDEKDIPKSAEIIDAEGGYVISGLIDIHIHGYKGEDASDASVEGLLKMSEEIIKNGVTAWCPTVMTLSEKDTRKALDAIREAKKISEGKDFKGAVILGANCEGPFLNPEKKGAQKGDNIIAPKAELILENKDIIRLLTIAPEMDKDFEFIKEITKNSDIIISMGHSSADFSVAKAAVDAGARNVTHLFNAMSPLNHRNPGLTGLGLADNRVSCELIADTIHINPGIFEMVYSLKGEKLVLITDCMRAGGLTDGLYDLGGQEVTVKGGECRLSDGTIAGSVLKLNNALKNFKENTSLSVYEIANMASVNAAKVIGEEEKRGSIKDGKRADFVITTSDFEVLKTIKGGIVC